MWIDVHTHFDLIKDDAEKIWATAQAQGVKAAINIGTEPHRWQVICETAEKLGPGVFFTSGVHPQAAHEVEIDKIEEQTAKFVNHPKFVAIGEIGLDYYRLEQEEHRDLQKKVFDLSLTLAAKHDFPVEIHTRDADADTAEFLKTYKGRARGLLHCFTGSYELAKAALDSGFDISISGIITFKNAESLRDTVRKLPIDRIHVETDAPYLAPVPVRGKENRPEYVGHTGKFVAELTGTGLGHFAEQMELNCRRLFSKNLRPYLEACAGSKS